MNTNKYNRYHLKIIKNLFFLIFIFLIIYSHSLYASPKKIKINSVKSLTYILSKVEKENGHGARYVTLKLQIYLEDIYISQGTAVIFKPNLLSLAIKNLLNKGKLKNEIAKEILKRYKDGQFHD